LLEVDLQIPSALLQQEASAEVEMELRAAHPGIVVLEVADLPYNYPLQARISSQLVEVEEEEQILAL